MLKMVASFLVFCFSMTMVNQAIAQCSGGYDGYYGHATNYVSSNNFGGCGSYRSNNYSSYNPTSYVASKQYSSAPAVLPKPVFANSIPARSVPVVRNYSSPVNSYLPPISNRVRVTPSATSSYSSYGNYLNHYSQPSCANGNCPYR